MIRSSPLIAAAVVASVALGVGANSAVYSLFEQFLWRPLPVPQPERLVNLRSPGQRRGSSSGDSTGPSDAVFSHPLFRDIEREARLLSGVAGQTGAARRGARSRVSTVATGDVGRTAAPRVTGSLIEWRARAERLRFTVQKPRRESAQ